MVWAKLKNSRFENATKSGSAPPAPTPFVQTFQELIDALPEQIALVDERWTILAVNPAWTKTAAVYGYEALTAGANYAAFCRERAKEGHNAARPAVEGIAEIDSGLSQSFEYFYDGNDRWEGHTFHLRINRLSIEGRIFAIITRYDISELVQLRRQRETFSQSLLESQTEERRRFARELHDSIQQLLVAMSMSLSQLKLSRPSQKASQIVDQMDTLLASIHGEIRSISYLSHPPLLGKMGIQAALEELVLGFGRRAGLETSFSTGGTAMPIREGAEMAIYRTVQEALSNVHRHSHACKVEVRLIFRRTLVHAIIADDGIGMPVQVPTGVGLTGMRARLAELGGRLFVRHQQRGTALVASVPRTSSIRPTGDLAI